jgi:hypothetical protein
MSKPVRPGPQSLNSSNQYFPFRDRVAFDAADLLYRRSQLSKLHVDSLMQLWAASLFEHGASPPFSSTHDMLELIDSIKANVVKWQSFDITMLDESTPDTPSYEKDVYTVPFRDPHEIACEMLAREEFNGHFDDCAYQDFNAQNERVYMSACHSWERSVSVDYIHTNIKIYSINSGYAQPGARK